jgi:hypothetical protein
MKIFFFIKKVLNKFNEVLLMWQNGTQKHGGIIHDDIQTPSLPLVGSQLAAVRLPACRC